MARHSGFSGKIPSLGVLEKRTPSVLPKKIRHFCEKEELGRHSGVSGKISPLGLLETRKPSVLPKIKKLRSLPGSSSSSELL